jgi:lysophospholipase L1-like esterase
VKPLIFVLSLTILVASSLLARSKVDPALAPITDRPGLPRVLLIGDSISIGYTLDVRARLAEKANLHRIPENGGSTLDGLAKLDRWLGDGKWNVIHFNWGLHDLKHWKDGKLDLAGPHVASVEVYEKNLRELVMRLKATGAKLIFATTTPVPEGTAGRAAADEIKYNEAARRVMNEAGIAIDDLHAVAAAKLAAIQLPKNVHFRPEGSRLLGAQVADAITAALAK